MKLLGKKNWQNLGIVFVDVFYDRMISVFFDNIDSIKTFSFLGKLKISLSILQYKILNNDFAILFVLKLASIFNVSHLNLFQVI